MQGQKLGIDLGGKHVGLAVVRTPINEVAHYCTIELREDIKDKMDERRSLRRARRNRLWHREARFDNRQLRVKCKYIDKDTGEICGANTPKKSNVKHLLLENILVNLKIADESKEEIRRRGLDRDTNKSELQTILEKFSINTFMKKQIKDIILEKGEGRAVFCREHIPFHYEQVATEAESFWLSNSIRAKQDQTLSRLKRIAKDFKIDEVVIERANFDLQKLQRPDEIEAPEDYMKGPNFGHRNRFEALKQEYGNRCCFCGKKGGDEVKLKIGHLYPKAKDEINRWENLITICEKCNAKQGKRTPEEAGMEFVIVKEKVFNPAAGMVIPIKRELKPKPINESKVNKYMTHTDIGIRRLKREIQNIFGSIPIRETYGYITSYFRNKWELEKEHYNDAVVIASDKEDLNIKPVFKDAVPQTIKSSITGGKLFDTTPLQFSDGKFYQNITLIGRKAGMRSSKHKRGQRNIRNYGSIYMDEIELITSEWKKKVLCELRDKLGYVKGDKNKSFKPEELMNANLPFRTVTIDKRGVGESSTRLINNNVFRASAEVNTHIMVYSNNDGRMKAFAVKNPKIFKDAGLPHDFQKKIFIVKKGDIVTWKKSEDGIAVTGRVTKCLTKNGVIDIKDMNNKIHSGKNPVYIEKIVSPERGAIFERKSLSAL